MTRWSWLVVLVGCIVLFVLLDDRSALEPPATAPRGVFGEPDLYMEKATITQYDEDGSIRYVLQSDEVRHFEAEALTRLVAPTLTLNRAPQMPWLARAKEGFVRFHDAADGQRREVVVLRDDVHLEQSETDNPVELTCPALHIFPDRRFAETDQPVTIIDKTGRTTAVGLSGDLSSGQLKLSSNAKQRVHTVVLPAQFKRATAETPL